MPRRSQWLCVEANSFMCPSQPRGARARASETPIAVRVDGSCVDWVRVWQSATARLLMCGSANHAIQNKLRHTRVLYSKF